jgi:hypothetical protein
MITKLQLLQYFGMTLGTTVSAIMFSLAVENWKDTKYKYAYAVVASILLTPLGAWIISTFVRFKELRSQNTRTLA